MENNIKEEIRLLHTYFFLPDYKNFDLYNQKFQFGFDFVSDFSRINEFFEDIFGFITINYFFIDDSDTILNELEMHKLYFVGVDKLKAIAKYGPFLYYYNFKTNENLEKFICYLFQTNADILIYNPTLKLLLNFKNKTFYIYSINYKFIKILKQKYSLNFKKSYKVNTSYYHFPRQIVKCNTIGFSEFDLKYINSFLLFFRKIEMFSDYRIYLSSYGYIKKIFKLNLIEEIFGESLVLFIEKDFLKSKQIVSKIEFQGCKEIEFSFTNWNFQNEKIKLSFIKLLYKNFKDEIYKEIEHTTYNYWIIDSNCNLIIEKKGNQLALIVKSRSMREKIKKDFYKHYGEVI